jgi:stage III sporulation protein AC
LQGNAARVAAPLRAVAAVARLDYGGTGFDVDLTEENMDVGLILRVAGIGLLVAMAAQILSKSGRDEQATFVTVAGMIVVFFMLIREIGALFDTVRSTFGF